MCNVLFRKCTPSLCIYACLCSRLCECMHLSHSFQGWGSRGWSKVHTMARNSGVRSVSLWNPKQTLRGSRPAWLKLTNHPEAPARPRAAQHTAPGNGCLNIPNVMCVWVCACTRACVCARGHMCIVPAWERHYVRVKCGFLNCTHLVSMPQIRPSCAWVWLNVVVAVNACLYHLNTAQYTRTSHGMCCTCAQYECYSEAVQSVRCV